jgi:hypothetical protein
LELPLPDTDYRSYGDDVIPVPNANFVAQKRLPTIGEDKFEEWMKAVAAAGAGCASKTVWDSMADSPTWNAVRKISERNKTLLAVLSVGSFTGGFFLGHRFGADFDAPEFRKALLDKNVWKGVWANKLKLLKAKSNLDIASANLALLNSDDNTYPARVVEMKQKIKDEYERLYVLDPELSPNGNH